MSRATLLDDIFGVPLIASGCLRFLCMQVRHVPRYMISSVSLGSLAVLLHGSLTRLDDSAAAAAAAAAAYGSIARAAGWRPSNRRGNIPLQSYARRNT